jgi:hypothetical protein
MQHTGLIRPRWAVGLTNQEVMAAAKHEGLNKVVICEARAGCFRHGTRETITDLKNQRAKLRRELANLYPLAAG